MAMGVFKSVLYCIALFLLFHYFSCFIVIHEYKVHLCFVIRRQAQKLSPWLNKLCLFTYLQVNVQTEPGWLVTHFQSLCYALS